MAHADRIAKTRWRYLVFVRISGIPYIFSNGKLPTAWDAGGGTVVLDGETYTWSPTLLLDGPINISRVAAPKEGVSKAGIMPFRFRMLGDIRTWRTDVWMHLRATSAFRDGSPLSVMTTTLLPNGSVVELDSTTDWPSSGDAYSNVETITYDDKNDGSAQLQTLTRGAYGSEIRTHPVSFGGQLESNGGALVTDHPTMLKDRFVEMWLAPAPALDGPFEPYGSTIASNENAQYWAGPILGGAPSRDRLSVVLRSASLDQVLAREACKIMPRAQAGLHPTQLEHQIAEDCNKLAWRWEWANDLSSGSPPSIQTQTPIPLDWDPPSAPVEEMPPGVYTDDQIANALRQTLGSNNLIEHMTGAVLVVSFYLAASDLKARLRITISGMSITPDAETWLTLDARHPDSVLRALGFEDAQTVQAVAGADSLQFTFEGDRAAPLFYLPAVAAPSGGRKVYYHTASGPAFQLPGYEDDNGNAIDGYARADDEAYAFDAQGLDAEGGLYINVVERGALGSQIQEHYIERKPRQQKYATLEQALAFPGCSSGRIMAYLAAGGSGASGVNHVDYDQDWWGGSAHIPARFLDIDGWVAWGQAKGEVWDSWAVWEATDLRTLFGELLKVQQSYMVSGLNSSNDLVLKIKDNRPPYEADVETPDYHIDKLNALVDGSDGVGADPSEDRLINHVKIQIGLDHGTGEYFDAINVYDVQSIATYGHRKPLALSIRGLISIEDAYGLAQDIASRVFSAFAHPYGILEYTVTRASFWATEISDDFTITDPDQPSLPSGKTKQTPTRGFTDLQGRLMAQQQILPAAQEDNAVRGVATVVISNTDGFRFSKICPGAWCHNLSSTTELQCYDHRFSATDADQKDVEHFEAGMLVRLYNPGDESSEEERTINSVTLTGAPDLSQIELTSPTTLSPPIIIEFADYDSAVTDEQRRYAYMSDGDHKLDDGSGNEDPPFKYA